MKALFFIIYVFVSALTFAQSFSDTIWFSPEWKSCERQNASYYRLVKQNSGGFIVSDFYLNNKPQMIAEAKALQPALVKNGQCIYFSKNGLPDEKGSYKDNVKTGVWIKYFDECKDSTVRRYNPDGTSETLMFAKSDEIYTITEKQAEFPGGINAMMKHIQTNLTYPKKCRELAMGGKVFLKFIVNEEGVVNNVEVIKSTGIKELDEEAIRVIKTMPKWSPAAISNRPVKCYFNLPLNFMLNEPYFIFNTFNSNPKHVVAKELLLQGKLDEALNAYAAITGDVEAWYNIAVIYYLKRSKKQSQEYFKNVITNISDTKSPYYVSTKRILEQNF